MDLSQPIRPPLVRFEVRPIEDRDASIAAGHTVYRDVNYAVVTSQGTNAEFEDEADAWLGRQHAQPYHHLLVGAYEAWKKGLEPPLNGTPIAMMPIFTPSEVKQIIGGGCRSGEDLAAWPDGALEKLGMGAIRLKQRAAAWFDASSTTGAAAQKMAAQTVKIEQQDADIADLRRQVADLTARIPTAEAAPPKTLSLKKEAAA